MTQKTTPIACSIPITEVGNRTLDLHDLLSRARSTERIDGGVIMRFEPGLAGDVADLVAKEAQCCGFLSMTTETSDSELRLVVTSDDPAGAQAIEAFLGSGVLS